MTASERMFLVCFHANDTVKSHGLNWYRHILVSGKVGSYRVSRISWAFRYR